MNQENIFSGKTLLVINSGSIKKEFMWKKMSQLGLKIILMNDEKNWAENYVSHLIVTDIFQPEVALKSIVSFLQVHPEIVLDGVVTFTEESVLLVSTIVDHFHLIGLPLAISERIRNKYQFRELCQKVGISVPKHMTVHEEKDLESLKDLQFPLVLKPIFGVNSVGVMKVNNTQELFEMYHYFKNHINAEIKFALKNGLDLMVEEYIEGDEVDIDVLLQDGEIKFISITDNFPTVEPFFIESGEIIPSRLSLVKQEELIAMVEKTFKEASIQNGCFHYEAKSTVAGAVPIELNLRIGGGDVYLYMKEVWGVDFIEGMIKIALGIPISKIPQPEPLKCMRSEVLRIAHPGILTELRFDEELSKKKYLEKIIFLQKPGNLLKMPPESYKHLGWITVSGTTEEEAKRNLEEAKTFIHFKIEKN